MKKKMLRSIKNDPVWGQKEVVLRLSRFSPRRVFLDVVVFDSNAFLGILDFKRAKQQVNPALINEIVER